jgi:Tfp pilus assembly protein PilE
MLNAFATRFFGRNFVVLLAGMVDALEDEPEGINFYIGHELGHLRMKHLTGRLWRLPVLWLPLLGAAYSRAQESTCDLHGRACCADPQAAARALMVLAAGPHRWKSSNPEQYAQQTLGNNGFWAGFHELINGYPWLSKRVWRVRDPATPVPARNPFAYVLAFFVPYGGRAGGGFLGFVYLVCIIGVLAAVAVPAYQQYVEKSRYQALLEKHSAEVQKAWTLGEEARTRVGVYFMEHHDVPASLEDTGASAAFPDGRALHFDAENMIVSVETEAGTLYMVPYIADESLHWTCQADSDHTKKALPASCRLPESEDPVY